MNRSEWKKSQVVKRTMDYYEKTMLLCLVVFAISVLFQMNG